MIRFCLRLEKLTDQKRGWDSSPTIGLTLHDPGIGYVPAGWSNAAPEPFGGGYAPDEILGNFRRLLADQPRTRESVVGAWGTLEAWATEQVDVDMGYRDVADLIGSKEIRIVLLHDIAGSTYMIERVRGDRQIGVAGPMERAEVPGAWAGSASFLADLLAAVKK